MICAAFVLGSVPCVLLSTVEATKELFHDNDEKLLSRPKMLAFEIMSDNYTSMIFAQVGPLWSSLRKLATSELFSPRRVASYAGMRAEELSNMMTLIQEKSEKGEPVNLKDWLYEVDANMMLRMLVNKRYTTFIANKAIAISISAAETCFWISET